MQRIITFTTDFGLKDPYQGAMKGAVYSINPGVKTADITHLITPGDILEGAFVLLDAYGFFPQGTIHVGVVDPGVGGDRRPVLIEAERHIFVGPDNGLLSLAAGKEKVKRVIHLTEKRFFLEEVSNTFHGRDIFGPVAAHLSLGMDPGGFGEEIKGYREIEAPPTRPSGGEIEGAVIYIDSFGNLITNIKAEDIPYEAEVVIKGVVLRGIKKTYSAVEKGAPAAIIGSSGRLEVAVNAASASKALGASVGEKVVLRAVKGPEKR